MNRRQHAFEAMVRGCTEDLYRYAYWLTRDRSTAEDLVQETLLRAWRFMDDLRDAGQVKAWLITTLRRESARRFERKGPVAGSRDFVELGDVENELADWETPEVIHERGELERRLHQLPRDYREVLVLQLLFGYSVDEIAALLKITVPAVNNRLLRGRKKLLADAGVSSNVRAIDGGVPR